MKVKLQPPSATELAPFNPILPPASITQIMLLANPTKVCRLVQAHRICWRWLTRLMSASSQEKVRMRYKLAFVLGDRSCNEVGEVDQFPPQETWGRL